MLGSTHPNWKAASPKRTSVRSDLVMGRIAPKTVRSPDPCVIWEPIEDHIACDRFPSWIRLFLFLRINPLTRRVAWSIVVTSLFTAQKSRGLLRCGNDKQKAPQNTGLF